MTPPSPKPKQIESSTKANVRIEEAIERELEGKVQGRDLHQVAQRITQIAVSEQFSGPMPHPKHLREYDDIFPGAAERILSMAEQNLAHNIGLNANILEAEIADHKLGMWQGAGLFALLILAAFSALFLTENAVIIGLFLGTAAIGGVGLFIHGRNGNHGK